MSVSADWVPPERFDEFRVVRPLGRGATGQVYLLHDELLDRPVAVKFFARSPHDSAARERFLLEARLIAKLHHPNVVNIHRVGQLAGRPYLISEYVDGTSLAAVRKPVPSEEVVRMALGLGRGLWAAHEQGILHRDIKPANIMRTAQGEAKLLDFGLAKWMRGMGTPPITRRAGESTHDRPQPTEPPSGVTRPIVPIDATAPATTTRSTLEAPKPASPVPPPALHLTSPDALLGTPRYMAPELWRSAAEASWQSDLYALGAVLFELCSGRPIYLEDNVDALRHAILTAPPPSLGEAVPGIEARLVAVVDRCLRPAAQERYASALELVMALEALATPTAAVLLPEGNPYRGLAAFQTSDRDLFFGRDFETQALVERLRTEPLVIVAGPSGVGKSSLCRAGVLPSFCADKPGVDRRWQAVILTPGPQPLTALEQAVREHLSLDAATLRTALADPADPLALGALLGGHLGDTRGVLFLVDQLEEMVTHSPPEDARRFGEIVLALGARCPHLRVLMTVRGDLLTEAAGLLGLGETLGRSLYMLGPLAAHGLRQAIVGPTHRKGGRFAAPETVEELVQAGAVPGGLPLVEFALAELWEARDRASGEIPHQALAAIGGVTGALARHATGVLERLRPAEQEAARRLLCRLVGPGGTRRRRHAEELGKSAPTRTALEALVAGRLVVAHEADGGGSSYELAHEALLQGWDRLRHWLDEDIGQRALRHRLDAAVEEWQRLGRGREGLAGRRLLDELAALDPNTLGEAARVFLTASRTELGRQKWRRRGVLAALPLLALVVYGSFSLRAYLRTEAAIADHLRQAQPLLADARAHHRAADKLVEDASARFRARDDGGGEAAWIAALDEGQAAEASHRSAERALSAALLLDARRPQARQMLLDALWDQALLSQRMHQKERHQDVLARIAPLDQQGEVAQRLDAPAELVLEGPPPGTVLHLKRYRSQAGRRILEPLDNRPALGTHRLTPDSYLLELAAPDHEPIRYPVLLHRGERYRLSLELPPAGSIPPGWIYVPPGRFLYGSADEEGFRRNFLAAQPLHEVHTGGYLIAHTELTFSEWLVFLRDLPPEERQARRPKATHAVFGTITLEDVDGPRPRLLLPLGGVTLSAGWDERLRYPDRSHRRDVDWQRLPVTGISFADGLAYAAWLRRSGRMPGARLCDEYEWERAARGADNRGYPHGDRLDADDANHDATYGRRPAAFGPDEVGSHPASDSPFGVADLAGNVWELVHSVSGREEVVIRGGGFYESARSSLSSNRTPAEPTLRDRIIGLRLCADPPWQGRATR